MVYTGYSNDRKTTVLFCIVHYKESFWVITQFLMQAQNTIYFRISRSLCVCAEYSRCVAQAQISHWEENLERLQVEQFRLRCYMASLQAGELPNPKVRHVRYWTPLISEKSRIKQRKYKNIRQNKRRMLHKSCPENLPKLENNGKSFQDGFPRN